MGAGHAEGAVLMGPYCNFCDRRCFVLRDLPDGSWSGLMATCAKGMEHDRKQTGYDHTTATNPLAAPDPEPQPERTPMPWPAGVDAARWLLGACSSGDPLRSALVAITGEVKQLRAALAEIDRLSLIVLTGSDADRLQAQDHLGDHLAARVAGQALAILAEAPES